MLITEIAKITHKVERGEQTKWKRKNKATKARTKVGGVGYLLLLEKEGLSRVMKRQP